MKADGWMDSFVFQGSEILGRFFYLDFAQISLMSS